MSRCVHDNEASTCEEQCECGHFCFEHVTLAPTKFAFIFYDAAYSLKDKCEAEGCNCECYED